MGSLMTIFSPRSLTEALQVLNEHPSARLLAGGTDTMVEINFRHYEPSDIVSLRHVSELQTFETLSSGYRVGSAIPYREFENGSYTHVSQALSEAARTVGSPQIRAAGTIGGNLGTCSPAGDTLPVLSAIDAQVELACVDGIRTVSIHDFMLGVKRNARATNEIITAIHIPKVSGFQGYAKVGVRNAMVISIASACLIHNTENRTIALALGAVGPTIIRCREAEKWLANNADLSTNTPLAADTVEEFSRIAASEARPITDHRSTAEYRKHAVGILAQRLLKRAMK
jgi:CO/xanthine dehydrogenase FAD-binding subunit